jgi:hypothetical protein
LRPASVVGAFDVPLGHLAFDDAWCCAGTTDRVQSAEQAAEEAQPAGAVPGVALRGESARVGDGLPGDPQRGPRS